MRGGEEGDFERVRHLDMLGPCKRERDQSRGGDRFEFTRDGFKFERLDTKYKERLGWCTLSFFPPPYRRCFSSDQKGAVDDLEMNRVRLFGGEEGERDPGGSRDVAANPCLHLVEPAPDHLCRLSAVCIRSDSGFE